MSKFLSAQRWEFVTRKFTMFHKRSLILFPELFKPLSRVYCIILIECFNLNTNCFQHCPITNSEWPLFCFSHTLYTNYWLNKNLLEISLNLWVTNTIHSCCKFIPDWRVWGWHCIILRKCSHRRRSQFIIVHRLLAYANKKEGKAICQSKINLSLGKKVMEN